MAGTSYDDEFTPSEPPPSYSEAISSPPPPIDSNRRSSTGRPAGPPPPSQNAQRPPPQPQRPPAQPQRPPAQGQRPTNQPPANQPSQSSIYTGNNKLPFPYPARYFCKKCKNTGFRGRDCCRDCWNKFYLKENSFNPNPDLPFKYPKKYFCDKCHNTGNKLKNGLSCKDCWSLYGPRNRVQAAPRIQQTYDPFFGGAMQTSTYIGQAPPMQFAPAPQVQYIPQQSPYNQYYTGPLGAQPPPPPRPVAPLRVRPGDPRIGGILCGRCRGSGLVWDFLDENTCPVCRGLGRIIH